MNLRVSLLNRTQPMFAIFRTLDEHTARWWQWTKLCRYLEKQLLWRTGMPKSKHHKEGHFNLWDNVSTVWIRRGGKCRYVKHQASLFWFWIKQLITYLLDRGYSCCMWWKGKIWRIPRHTPNPRQQGLFWVRRNNGRLECLPNVRFIFKICPAIAFPHNLSCIFKVWQQWGFLELLLMIGHTDSW